MFKRSWLILALAAFFLAACSGGNGDQNVKKGEKKEQQSEKKSDDKANKMEADGDTSMFGEKIDEKGAIPATELLAKMKGKDSIQIKVTGKVTKVCQKKGCWMNIDVGEDQEDVMVRFKDYGFFMPKDSKGDVAVMKGWAKRDTISVKHLKHYAKDAGKSEEEIAKIKEPEERITFTASGVILKNSGKKGEMKEKEKDEKGKKEEKNKG